MTELTPHTASYANKYGYSDVYPYEIVRVISAKTIEVREMDAERDPNWKPGMPTPTYEEIVGK